MLIRRNSSFALKIAEVSEIRSGGQGTQDFVANQAYKSSYTCSLHLEAFPT